MQELRRKIAIRLFCQPLTVISAAVGGSLLILSSVLGSGAAAWGMAIMLLGVGFFFTNLIFNLGNISRQALKDLQSQAKQSRDDELDKLSRQLFKTKGTRDEDILRNLRVLYDAFKSDLENGTLTAHVPAEMLRLIDDIFDTCITKLKATYALYAAAKKSTGDMQDKLMEQREDVLQEIELSLEKLSETIHEVRLLGLKVEKAEMSGLRDRLQSQLVVAKATEEALAGLNVSTEMDRFSEYERN